jgi:hypothetical protein
MALTVRNAEYFYIRIEDSPEKAYELLGQLASAEVSLLAFSAVPFGPNHLELTIFPDRSDTFIQLAKKLAWLVAGPQHAFLVQGDDNLGAWRTSSGCSWRLMLRFTPLPASPMAVGAMDI